MASPSKTEEEEGGGKRPRIVREILCRRSGEEPSTRNPENSAVGPVRPRETEEMEDGNEESWHDASEEGWEATCRRAKDGATIDQEDEADGRAEEDKVGNRHDRGTIRSAFHFGWDAIRAWIVQPNPDHDENQANAEPEAEQGRTGLDENGGRQV